MITSQQINWIAGLLEGEGTFRMNASGSPTLRIGMTDLDIIEKFRILTKSTDMKLMPGPSKPGWKPAYYTAIYGNLAIQWMMTIYPLMGMRRREKIKDIIENWKLQPIRKSNKKNISVIRSIAISRNISMGEAKEILDGLLNKTIQKTIQ